MYVWVKGNERLKKAVQCLGKRGLERKDGRGGSFVGVMTGAGKGNCHPIWHSNQYTDLGSGLAVATVCYGLNSLCLHTRCTMCM